MLLLIQLLSFFLPFQLAFHFNNFLETTVYGFRIDYLIPTLYLTDIITLLIIFLGLLKLQLKKKYIVYCILYIAFAATNILHSIYYIPGLYRWFKVTEMLLLGITILNTKKLDVFKNFIKPLSYSIIIICLLGIAQFLNKGSIGGIFYWFGERQFIFNSPNISPYPYSTFSHPNSFAGFLLVFLILLLGYRKKFNLKYFWLLLILVILNLILTNSLNVYLAIVFLLSVKFIKGNNFPLILIDLNARYITYRIELIKNSLKMIKDNLLFGVGLNNFIPNLVKYSNTFVNSWELQPVHNIYFLIFSETGIFGLIIFLTLIFNFLTLTNYPLLAILVTGLNDHYWLTLQQNILLFTFVLALSKVTQKH